MTDPDFPRLVADIGGTNARFGLVRSSGGAVTDVVSMRCSSHASPEAAALHYLDALAGDAGAALRPRRVALAVASTISGDTVKLTNSDWVISRSAMAAALGASQVMLINDFEALALALPELAADEVAWIGGARPSPGLPMAVVGPGTGLGVALCVPTPGGFKAVACEGGHVTASPADDFESDLLQRARLRIDHVSAERLLSGIGLPLLYSSLCEVLGAKADSLSAADITRLALNEQQPQCLQTLDVFCAMLGGFAGNVALTTGARGGVFIAGGIAGHLGDHFLTSRFRERFEAKGRFKDYLSTIATGVITAPHAALDGAAQALRTDVAPGS
jgi:glucokinase